MHLLAEHSERMKDYGKAGVVPIVYQSGNAYQTGLGTLTVRIPKVRARIDEPVTLRSALVPPYVRMTECLEADPPWLHLKGIFSAELCETLMVLMSMEAEGLSAGTVSHL